MATGLENQDQELDYQDQELAGAENPEFSSETPGDESTETQTLDQKRWEYQQARADRAEAEALKIKSDLAEKELLLKRLMNSNVQTQQVTQQVDSPLTPPQMPADIYDTESMAKYYADSANYNAAVLNAKSKELDEKISRIQQLEEQRIKADETARARSAIMQQLISEGATDEEARMTMNLWVDKAAERQPRDYLEATRVLMELQGHKVDKQIAELQKQKADIRMPFSVNGGVNEQHSVSSFSAKNENRVSSGLDAMSKFRP